MVVLDRSAPRTGEPLHSERHARIICIGAGASGLCFAYKLQRSFENFSLSIFEKNPDLAGTWYENRYPGCACDIPSHNYTYSFEPKTDWSGIYASSKEILKYFQDFAIKYDLNKHITLNSEVVGATWNEDTAEWSVSVKNLKTEEITTQDCDILINACGILNAWKWPAITGLHNFGGKLLHSADWDESINLEGMKVALIGNGSSGIQILPAIQSQVESVVTFVRAPTWISPVKSMEQKMYTAEEKDAFANKPGNLLQYRKEIESGLNGLWPLYIAESDSQKESRAAMVERMKQKINNKDLEEKLIPNWGLGCRRITPGVNYLETLTASNVEVVHGGIETVTKTGVRAQNGKSFDFDIIICATGFDTSFKPRFPLLGPKGKNLQDLWSDEPNGYMGLAVGGFPNYMMFLGPNCPIGNGPVIVAIECQADYMLSFVDRWQTENIRSFAPKADAVRDFNDYTDGFMKQTVWNNNCRSWYKRGTADGRVSALWPGSSIHYMEAMKQPRFDDWDIEYAGNRFEWLGNGFSQTELDRTCDLAWYITEVDEGPYTSKAKNRKILTKSGTQQPKNDSGNEVKLF